MPSTKISLSLHTADDKDLVAWVDGFSSPRKRNEKIKEILRNSINGIVETDKKIIVNNNDEKLDELIAKTERVYRELMRIKTQAVSFKEEERSDEISEQEQDAAIENILRSLDWE